MDELDSKDHAYETEVLSLLKCRILNYYYEGGFGKVFTYMHSINNLAKLHIHVKLLNDDNPEPAKSLFELLEHKPIVTEKFNDKISKDQYNLDLNIMTDLEVLIQWDYYNQGIEAILDIFSLNSMQLLMITGPKNLIEMNEKISNKLTRLIPILIDSKKKDADRRAMID